MHTNFIAALFSIVYAQAGNLPLLPDSQHKELSEGYTCNSRTMETPSFSSGLNVSGEHFLKRSNPIKISTD